MQLDLFKLHDPVLDNKPRKWIVAKGQKLEQNLSELIEKLIARGWNKTRLWKHMMKKLRVYQPSAERLVSLRAEFFPLIFIEELLKLTNNWDKRFRFQETIEVLKANQPPEKIVKAPKELTSKLCKIAGAHAADGTLANNFFCITDGHKDNVEAFGEWLEKAFAMDYNLNKISENEWGIRFHGKVFARYLHHILGFPNGKKVYSTGEPEIIKNSNLGMRKAFAVGALTFEAGVGIKNQVEFCVASKKFQEDLCEILELVGVKYHKMEKQSCSYWRFWSNALTKKETRKWMQLFEPKTEKWFKLYDTANGYHGKVNSVKEAVEIFDIVYPCKPASKVSLKKVFLAIKKLKKTYRYKLADYLAKEAKIKSFGGKWAHGLKHYLDILKQANVISVELRQFGKKKSFGTIVREVYIFNPKVSDWQLPIRNRKAFSDDIKSPTACFVSSTA